MKRQNIVILVILLVSLITVQGCGRVETFGGSITNRNITPIKDIVSNPEKFAGKPVTVKGVIALECTTGCWFNLKDGSDVIYTDINPSGFAIPQKVGKTAVVEGTVSIEEGRLTLTGKAVEIK